MKRKTTSKLLNESPKKAARQDPVSCQSCRRRKLKCNRQKPCGSCVTRRLTCSYASESGGMREIAEVPEVSSKTDASPLLHEPAFHSERVKPATVQPIATSRSSRTIKDSVMTADWLEKIVMADRVPTAMSRSLRDSIDCEAFVGLGSNDRNAGLGEVPRFFLDRIPSSENPATIDLCSFLPTKSETLSLFRYYCDHVSYLYHIIISSRVEFQINTIYQCVDKGSPVDLGHLALLFSIVASSVYCKFSLDCSAYAERCGHEFGYLAGAALIQNNYTIYPTLEGLQATVIVMHNLPSPNGHPSTNVLFMHGTIVNQGRSLMLHCIDTPRCRDERETHGFDGVEVELKRRLWWDIASFDWLLGFLSGPQEWTYLVNPDMMNVQEPLNIDDSNFQEVPNVINSALSTPTEMSYTLQRLKLAAVCREITDATTYEHMHSIDVSYDKILDLDRRLHQAYNELPDFFRLDPVARRRFASLYQSRPTIAWQRCLLHQGYHSRFCRLHRLYFIRGARDPAYSYSHVICLQSARKVIETKRILDEEEPKLMPGTSVVWSVMHHVFMAAVILLMDVCFNWDDLLADKRKQEVLDVCRMLSKAQQSSSMVSQGIKAMMDILQKHWKTGKQLSSDEQSLGSFSPPGLDNMTGINPEPLECGQEPTESNRLRNQLDNSHFHRGDDGCAERPLEDIWTEMLDSSGDLSFHTPDWTGLLAELTNATLPYT